MNINVYLELTSSEWNRVKSMRERLKDTFDRDCDEYDIIRRAVQEIVNTHHDEILKEADEDTKAYKEILEQSE